MYIVISQYYESCFVFSPLQPFNYKQSHFALASLVAILRNGRSSCQKVFPVSPPPKTCREEVSLLKRSKPKGTQYKDSWDVDVF